MSRFRALCLLVLVSCITLTAPARSQPAGALGDDFIHRVRPGDTLIDLASRYTRSPTNWAGSGFGWLTDLI